MNTQDHRVVRPLSTGQNIGACLREPPKFLCLVRQAIADPIRSRAI